MLTEWGVDRYKCVPSALTYNGQPGTFTTTCATFYPSREASSREDQESQRTWVASQWDDMAPQVATSANPQGAVAGGTLFMFADPWSKCELCSGAVHDVTGRVRGPIASPDGVENIEWFGVAHAHLRGQSEPRVTSLAFDALAARWAATAPPTLTGADVVQAPPCTSARVVWTTSEPASSEVQLAAFGEVFSDAGDMTADNSIFRRVAYDAALTTSHDVTITVTPGQSDRAVSAWKAVARSFTPDGRSATSAPLVFRC
jgi:hypothetical protein